LVLTGCKSPEKSGPIWESTKIGDLAPSRSGKRPDDQLLKTINFDIYIFEIPAENIGALDDVWQMLSTKPMRYSDYDAFVANSFLVGFGKIQMWNKIGDLLRAGGAEKVKTVSLLLSDGQADDLDIVRLHDKQTIFYISRAGSMEGATVGRGTLALRIKAKKIPGFRRVCSVEVQPAFSPPAGRSVVQLAGREKTGDLLFTAAGFKLKMSPGDFLFLGPEKYIENQTTLAGLFFSPVRNREVSNGVSRPRRQPVIRTYLIVCGRISY